MGDKKVLQREQRSEKEKMTKHLEHEFKDSLREVDFNHLDGIRYVFIFDNGYGASVIKYSGSYGGLKDLWELAVLKKNDNGEYYINYNTPITNDVLGYLSDKEVNNYLSQIKEL